MAPVGWKHQELVQTETRTGKPSSPTLVSQTSRRCAKGELLFTGEADTPADDHEPLRRPRCRFWPNGDAQYLHLYLPLHLLSSLILYVMRAPEEKDSQRRPMSARLGGKTTDTPLFS